MGSKHGVGCIPGLGLGRERIAILHGKGEEPVVTAMVCIMGVIKEGVVDEKGRTATRDADGEHVIVYVICVPGPTARL